MVFPVGRGVAVRMAEGVGGVRGGDRECERHAVSLLGDRHDDAVGLSVPEQGDGDTVVGPLIELANHVGYSGLMELVDVSDGGMVGMVGHGCLLDPVVGDGETGLLAPKLARPAPLREMRAVAGGRGER